MSQDTNIDALYTTADKFINLANELSQKDTSGTVGSALRYAAARYSAFEASMVSKDMKEEREAIKEALIKDYGLMLDSNLDTYIQYLESQAEKK